MNNIIIVWKKKKNKWRMNVECSFFTACMCTLTMILDITHEALMVSTSSMNSNNMIHLFHSWWTYTINILYSYYNNDKLYFTQEAHKVFTACMKIEHMINIFHSKGTYNFQTMHVYCNEYSKIGGPIGKQRRLLGRLITQN